MLEDDRGGMRGTADCYTVDSVWLGVGVMAIDKVCWVSCGADNRNCCKEI